MSGPGSSPTHDLAELQSLVRARQWFATWEAVAQAGELRLDADMDIEACVLALDAGDFYKTMESTAKPGTWQDVYKPRYQGHRLYVKLRLQTGSTRKTVVIQFKKDQSK
jgi:hypothetical protein